jgi:hypothetical protein
VCENYLCDSAAECEPQETVEGHGFLARPKTCHLEKGFSTGQPRLKPFLMELDFAGLKARRFYRLIRRT